ncbi:hypothetical protein CPB84DRAFT_351780 [Gymnopilus junonius]|uniref:Uncharacterized protein n=1 Tax=Gymnopilus junonius TaxID=109634 RepID=A0A9P5NAC0_GYMJU|nr:hypothetical protein CPB84DRAFT_351780 [Gymnopilus junonius]
MPALALLKEATPKIRSLVINVPFHEAWQKLVTSIGEGQAAPLLERLVITIQGDVNEVQNNGPYTTLSTAFTPSPNLAHLQLPAWPIPATPPPQLSTVTSLTFDTPFSGLDIPALFPCVQAATHLQHFKFKAVDMGAESDPNYSNIFPVPKLRSVDVTTPGFGLDMLGNFNAPHLADVRLDGFRDVVPDAVWEEQDWGWDIVHAATAILTKLSTRSPEIRRLDLYYVHFADPKEDFNSILSGQALPALEELILERSDLPDVALTENASKPSNLKKLVLRNCKYITINGLLPFIQGRASEEFVLKVKDCQGIGPEDIEFLSKLVRVKSA